jgi:Peptidase family M28
MSRLEPGVRLGLALLAAMAVPGLAGGAAPGHPAESSSFSGARAFQDLRYIVSLGPRPPGSKALAAERRWITGQLQQAGWTVEEDAYTAQTPLGAFPEVNLIAKLPGASPKILMIAGHYDTKIFKQFRFVGANDGGSSAAFLVELARVLAGKKHPFTYWLVFFDGEEAVEHWTSTDGTYGSRHLVSKLTADGDLGRVQAMILVDMIGDAHLDIERESNSTPWLTQLVFSAARELGYHDYFRGGPQSVDDDHVPFLNAGVSAVDLIDFDYGPQNRYWHTAQDTVEHCSPLSLTIVGRVVLAALDKLETSPRLK